MAFIQLGWVSRVDEMILARVSSGFAGEKVWEDIQVVPGFLGAGKRAFGEVGKCWIKKLRTQEVLDLEGRKREKRGKKEWQEVRNERAKEGSLCGNVGGQEVQQEDDEDRNNQRIDYGINHIAIKGEKIWAMLIKE
ncbi:hypothetical protein Tco_1546734 [Tanacetum coccineum]